MSQLVTVSDARMQAALAELARVTKKEYGVVIRREARLIAVQMARVTQPFGDGADAKRAGEFAVRRDFSNLYAPAFVAFQVLRDKDPHIADAFWAAFQNQNWSDAERILRASETRWRNVPVQRFDKSLHKKFRNRQGRVSRQIPAQIVTNPKAMNTYREQEVKLVGFAKGGWASAAKQIGGTRGIPQWVTRHTKAGMGNAVDNSNDPNNPHVILNNTVSYIGRVCPADARKMVLRIQRNKMLKHIEKVTGQAIHQADLD